MNRTLIRAVILAMVLLTVFIIKPDNSFAQTKKKTIAGVGFQQQYTRSAHGYSEVIQFLDKGKFLMIISNLVSGDIGEINGHYSIKGNSISLTDEQGTLSMEISWVNDCMFETKQEDEVIRYAIVLSECDTFMNDYLKEKDKEINQE